MNYTVNDFLDYNDYLRHFGTPKVSFLTLFNKYHSILNIENSIKNEKITFQNPFETMDRQKNFQLLIQVNVNKHNLNNQSILYDH